jgi:hypothetical protein
MNDDFADRCGRHSSRSLFRPHRPSLEARELQSKTDGAIRGRPPVSGARLQLLPHVPRGGAFLAGRIQGLAGSREDLSFEIFDHADRHWRNRDRSAAAVTVYRRSVEAALQFLDMYPLRLSFLWRSYGRPATVDGVPLLCCSRSLDSRVLTRPALGCGRHERSTLDAKSPPRFLARSRMTSSSRPGQSTRAPGVERGRGDAAHQSQNGVKSNLCAGGFLTSSPTADPARVTQLSFRRLEAETVAIRTKLGISAGMVPKVPACSKRPSISRCSETTSARAHSFGTSGFSWRAISRGRRA